MQWSSMGVVFTTAAVVAGTCQLLWFIHKGQISRPGGDASRPAASVVVEACFSDSFRSRHFGGFYWQSFPRLQNKWTQLVLGRHQTLAGAASQVTSNACSATEWNRPLSWLKLQMVLGLKMIKNIWDKAAQQNIQYTEDHGVFRHFNAITS